MALIRLFPVAFGRIFGSGPWGVIHGPFYGQWLVHRKCLGNNTVGPRGVGSSVFHYPFQAKGGLNYWVHRGLGYWGTRPLSPQTGGLGPPLLLLAIIPFYKGAASLGQFGGLGGGSLPKGSHLGTGFQGFPSWGTWGARALGGHVPFGPFKPFGGFNTFIWGGFLQVLRGFPPLGFPRGVGSPQGSRSGHFFPGPWGGVPPFTLGRALGDLSPLGFLAGDLFLPLTRALKGAPLS